MSKNVNELLNKRSATHGDYKDVAEFSQNMKVLFSTGKNWEKLNNNQKEAIEMMCSKFARIMSGDQNFPDHWDDLSGYAMLASAYSGVSLPHVEDTITEVLEAGNVTLVGEKSSSPLNLSIFKK
jgi:hypothetical protein